MRSYRLLWVLVGAAAMAAFFLMQSVLLLKGVATSSAATMLFSNSMSEQQFNRHDHNISWPIDVSVTQDASALRRIARSRAVRMTHGPELLLLATNLDGSSYALNALLNMHALGYKHHLVLAYSPRACFALGIAASQLVARGGKLGAAGVATATVPCIVDSWWDEYTWIKRKRNRLNPRYGGWLFRWSVFARLVRLGYNVLSVDVDAVLLDDVYPHLHSQALCGRFSLMFAPEGRPWKGQHGIQNGVVYACGAQRDGAAAWLVQESVDRYLRLADSCGGSFGATDTLGTPCPRSSWLHEARNFDGFAFDQYALVGAMQTAISRDGSHWWQTLDHMLDFAPPFRANLTLLRSQLRRVRNAQASAKFQLVRGRPPDVGRKHGEHIEAAAGGHLTWIDTEIIDSAAMAKDDISATWRARFGLHSETRGIWAPMRAAVPLATHLPIGVADVLEGNNVSAALRGLLPYRRGRLSRAWQKLLDEDLADQHTAATPLQSPSFASARVSDGDGGASWAPAPQGDEALVTLPAFVTCHYSLAQLGLVGSVLPRTLIFHATNAADKQLALQANGYWVYEAALATSVPADPQRAKMSTSPQNCDDMANLIWREGSRPHVIALAPDAARSMVTSSYNEYLEEVVKPLLLAALISGRVPAFPAIPCSTNWLVPSKANAQMQQRNVSTNSNGTYHWGACRTGACSYRVIAAGGTTFAEIAADQQLARLHGYHSPFAELGGAEQIARAPLQCTPMLGFFPNAPFGNPPYYYQNNGCLAGRRGYLLHPPAWETYRRILDVEGRVGQPSNLFARCDGVDAASVEFEAFEAALRGKNSSFVLHLPSRLRIMHVPQDMEQRFARYCDFSTKRRFGGRESVKQMLKLASGIHDKAITQPSAYAASRAQAKYPEAGIRKNMFA